MFAWLLWLWWQNPAALFAEGEKAYAEGRREEAIQLFGKAADLAPAEVRYRLALGTAYASIGDYSSALPPLRKACAEQPKLADACYYLGRALYFSDRYAEALKPLETAARADTVSGRPEAALGQALEALGDRDAEAEAAFRNALAKNGAGLQQARIAYGKFLLRQARIDESIQQLESAQTPESADALLQLARALMQASQADVAAARLERLVQIEPTNSAARLLLAKAYRRLGRNADAVRQEQAAQGSVNSK